MSENLSPQDNEEIVSQNESDEYAVSTPFYRRKRFVYPIFGLIAVVLLIFFVGFVAFRTGQVDRYAAQQLIAKMDEAGARVEIGGFHIGVAPFDAELNNVVFYDKLTGEKLLKADRLKLDISVRNMLSWRMEQEFIVDAATLDGLEVWVKFDENGKSNFSNLNLVTDDGEKSRFVFTSAKFALNGGIVHYGDLSRKLGGTANDVVLRVEPLQDNDAEDNTRYNFDFASTKSNLIYDDKPLDPINIRAKGIVGQLGAELSSLVLETPIGTTNVRGTLNDWENLTYKLAVESSLNLQKTAEVYDLQTALRGIADFTGTIEGKGDTYELKDAEIVSDALAADNVRLQGLRADASVSGHGDSYQANAEIVAELLNAGDFQLSQMEAVGKIVGTGKDFKWFGDLQAAAGRFNDNSIAGLNLADAYAEYQNDKLSGRVGSLTAGNFISPDAALAGVRAGNIRFAQNGENVDVTIPNIRAAEIKAEDTRLANVSADGIRVRNNGSNTEINASTARAAQVSADGTRISNLSANNLHINNRGANTNVRVGSATAGEINADGARLGNVRAENGTIDINQGRISVDVARAQAENLQTGGARLRNVRTGGLSIKGTNGNLDINAHNATAANVSTEAAEISDINATSILAQVRGRETIVSIGRGQVARVAADAATLGRVNIAGVRLKIVEGRIEGESSSPITAENVTLAKNRDLPQGGQLGSVRLTRPVFVIESADKYRASFDLSLGGGAVGAVNLGAVRSSVRLSDARIQLADLNAQVLDGTTQGEVNIGLKGGTSAVNLSFDNIEVAKLMAMTGGQILPVAGKTNGSVNLTFAGTNFKTASGTVTAQLRGEAGNAERGLMPINGRLGLIADKGLFNIDYANLNTEKSEVTARGRFDLNGTDSDLNIALNSSDAKEIQRLVATLGVAPELDRQLADLNAELGGSLTFNGNIRGNLSSAPALSGRAALESLYLKGNRVGALAASINLLPDGTISLTNGVLEQNGGGRAEFAVAVPNNQQNIAVNADLKNINLGKVLAALPVDVPAQLRDLNAEASGKIELTGIPSAIFGTVDVATGSGTAAGIAFDSIRTRINLQNDIAGIEQFELRAGSGILTANGEYNRRSSIFDFRANGQNIEVARFRSLFGEAANAPDLSGTFDLTASGTGSTADFKTFNINFDGAGRNVAVNQNTLGDIRFVGRTQNQLFTANLTAQIAPNTPPQVIAATLNFGNERLPFNLQTTLDNVEFAPYLALLQKPDQEPLGINGRVSGNVVLGGNLYDPQADGGKGRFSPESLSGEARLTQLSATVRDTAIAAAEPIILKISPDAVTLQNPARFVGNGTDFVVNGTKSLTANAVNNLSVDGNLNLSILNLSDTFFAGNANVRVRLTGANSDPRLNGVATAENASISTLVSNRRFQLSNVKTRIIFNTDQAQIDRLEATLGGGRITGSGGVILQNLQPERLRFDLRAVNVTTPLPQDIIASGDASININGARENNQLNLYVSGNIVARRAEYTRDIDIAEFLNQRGGGSLSESSGDGNDANSSIGKVFLDVRVEGRDALVIRNNLADVTASASLRITGDTDEPIISGRVTATEGEVSFRDERYTIQRAVITLPAERNAAPIVNLQAETEIKGYQIFIGLNGEVSSTAENLNASLRSNPALPQSDVVSLITTGNLANDAGGIPTLAQGGIDTAARLLTDSIINQPLSRATDKLFGLNKFEIDPILSGTRNLNPTARLTVGRQINRNLLVTYSTNLSSERSQVLALEYRVSNKLSFVAQYEQDAVSNVTRRDNNFSFEIRFRRRF